ncbi:ATP-binding cassette domain-containing protein [Flavobacterium psychrophilum]|uniref:ATP-binding cassette domain-containing protein n=1 Tax=Flavobacterium psychrophilum TaxID=96345 RepID=UPI000A3903E7|nr:ATP-binding cassette domain-containing protein [Flavobacterium psychrophilum]EKT4550718.1 ATP-binding cassette domain-containing protein [Flavobacterium psychrophilum]ELM3645055.1 ATP-binding cassette domain-containing protein [Flavobacterium psychrophilum]OUD22952.1 ABC transporter ATP-binding protein [Flavobacterium psychrophilum]
MNSLIVKNIQKEFKNKQILNNVSIECKTNEIISIFGRNGSGKSTLLKSIFGTIKSDTIEILINEHNIKPENVIKSKKIAYLPQNSFLPKNLKISNIIRLYFKNGEQQDKIFYSSGINLIQNKSVGNLSIGELRYFEFLLLCNLDHYFLLLDEPFSMIDPMFIELIKEKLMSIKKEKGIILTDHYYNDVIDISDKLYLIKDSKIISIKDKNDLIKHNYLVT